MANTQQPADNPRQPLGASPLPPKQPAEAAPPRRPVVTVLLPVYNEEACIEGVHAALCEVLAPLEDRYAFELLMVDDGSTDATPERLATLRRRDPRVHTVSLSRNFGKEAALLAGMDHSHGRCLIIMDSDGQHPADAIPRMLGLWEQGYDDVYGLRTTSGMGPLRRLTSRAYHKLIDRLASIDLSGDVGDFRLLDRRCVDAIRSLRETERYTKGMYAWVGFRKAPLEFETAERSAGASKMSLGRLAGLAVDGVTSFSTAPLRLASWLGIAISIVAFCYLVYILVKTWVLGDPVAGFPTLACLMLLLGGAILLCLGIVGEYVGRIFLEAKRRPPYIVDRLDGRRPDTPSTAD